jgi:plastocyanin
MKRGVVIVAFGLLGLTAAGCGGGYGGGSGKSQSSTATESGGSGGGQKTIAGVKANDHGTKSVSGKTEVELDDYYFKPSLLEGKAGSKVTLELENEGHVAHTFTIDSQGIDQNLDPGASATVTVTIPKAGAVSFYCRYHKSSGMAGALAVGGSGGMTSTGKSSGAGGTTTSSYDGY